MAFREGAFSKAQSKGCGEGSGNSGRLKGSKKTKTKVETKKGRHKKEGGGVHERISTNGREIEERNGKKREKA